VIINTTGEWRSIMPGNRRGPMNILMQVVVSGLTGSAIGAAMLGIFGFLVAGTDGVLNGLVLGGAIGLFAGMGMVGYVGNALWWRGVIGRYGDWRQRRESGEDEN
jgi:hypothetical protein